MRKKKAFRISHLAFRGSKPNGPMEMPTSFGSFVIASDRRERGNPVLLLESWGLDRHVAALLAMTVRVFSSLNAKCQMLLQRGPHD